MKTDSDSIAELLDIAHKGKANPFEILGLPAWIVCDLSADQLKEILRSCKKTLAKLFHPDSPLHSETSTYQQRIALCANQALHDLLSDDWYLKKCASAYKNGSLVDLLKERLRVLEVKNQRCRDEIRELREKIRELINKSHEDHKYFVAQIGLMQKAHLDRETEIRKTMRKTLISTKRRKSKLIPLGTLKSKKIQRQHE
jgi:hypothetical protein